MGRPPAPRPAPPRRPHFPTAPASWLPARWVVVVAVALVILLAGACAQAGSAGEGRLRIVTTVAPLTSIVAAVAGDLASVHGIVPEGRDSHTFEPPPGAARALARADVVFVNGLGLEEPTRQLAASVAPGAEIVSLGDLAIGPDEHIYDRSFPRSAGRPNPHLWTDPPLARRYAEIVADTLARRDPARAGGYRANLARFAQQADALDRAVRAATATIPPERRLLLTYHDAFAYFARRYGWEVVGAIQPSSFAEPTPRDVAGLIAQVRQAGVPAIFGSEVFPSPVLEQIGRETGVRYVDVLRDDDLPGDPGDPEHSWLGLLRFDFVTMVEALGGDASVLRTLDVTPAVPDGATYAR